MLTILIAVASAHDFSSASGSVPKLPTVEAGEAGEALQLLMLPFMQELERFATLESLALAKRSPRVDKVFVQCDAALKNGVRPGEAGYDNAAKRQQKGVVMDCMDAAGALAKKVGVDGHKGKAAELLSPAASQPRFGRAECTPVMKSLTAAPPSAAMVRGASVDGPWRPAKDASGAAIADCWHHRCDFR